MNQALIQCLTGAKKPLLRVPSVNQNTATHYVSTIE